MGWSNWSGRVHAEAAEVRLPESEADVVQAVLDARRTGRCVRVAGAGHSHSPLVVTEGIVLDLRHLSGIHHVDRTRKIATVGAGARMSDLGRPFREHGLAFVNQGDIDRQAIAGATATGTHGTGPGLRNLSACVTGARLVLADGSVVECERSNATELFEVARLSLGAVGVMTQVSVELREAYRLEEEIWPEDLDVVLERISELVAASRHFEFFWMPGHRRAACKALRETDAPPKLPLGPEGSRRSWSHEVFPSDRPVKHTEMEYALPAEVGVACLRALRSRIALRHAALAWPLEFRTVASDDVWLSPAYGRETVTISVHQGVEHDERELFRDCEAIFLEYGGRPHWGKVHLLAKPRMAELHPRFADWWRVRDAHDAEGRFLNAYLEEIRPR